MSLTYKFFRKQIRLPSPGVLHQATSLVGINSAKTGFSGLIGRKALEKELVGKAMDVIDSVKTIIKVAGENEGSLWLSICEKEKGKR